VLNPKDETARALKHEDNKFYIAVKKLEGDQKAMETMHSVRMKLSGDPAVRGAVGVARYGEPSETRHEDLGSQVIEGIACTGTRETRTIAADAIGNERPIEITSEFWRSADLHLIVLSKHNDPRTGETVYKLTDLKRDEPDPALFQVPSNYKVIENETPRLKP
jgi:hypothetical protein